MESNMINKIVDLKIYQVSTGNLILTQACPASMIAKIVSTWIYQQPKPRNYNVVISNRLSNVDNFTNSLHCNYYISIVGTENVCSPEIPKNVGVRFGGDFPCLVQPSFIPIPDPTSTPTYTPTNTLTPSFTPSNTHSPPFPLLYPTPFTNEPLDDPVNE